MNSGHEYGVASPKDYSYEAISSSIENSFPTTYEVKYQGAEMKNQGAYPTCVACTLATVLEAWVEKATGNKLAFSEGFNFGALRKSSKESGGMIHSVALDLQLSIGSVPKSMYEIVLTMPEAYTELEKLPGLFEEAKKWRFANYVKLNNGDYRTGRKKDLEIKDALTKYDVPLFCICPSYFGNSHAIAIVGWDDEADKYILKNSYGEKWGTNGKIAVSKNEIREVYLLLYEPIKLSFTDVRDTDWFYTAVKAAYMAGIVKGKSETTFDPHGYVTRAELAAVVSRLLDKSVMLRNDVVNYVDIKAKYNKLGKD